MLHADLQRHREARVAGRGDPELAPSEREGANRTQPTCASLARYIVPARTESKKQNWRRRRDQRHAQRYRVLQSTNLAAFAIVRRREAAGELDVDQRVDEMAIA